MDDPLTDKLPDTSLKQPSRNNSLFDGLEPEQVDTDVLGSMDKSLADLSIDPRVLQTLRVASFELRRRVCESGNNGGLPHERYVRWFGNLGPLPWCAFFVSWCWDNATDRNRRVPWSNPGYVPSVHDWARQYNRLVSQPQAGDLFGINGDHMGWIWGTRQGGIVTIEGNTRTGCIESYHRPNSGLWFVKIA